MRTWIGLFLCVALSPIACGGDDDSAATPDAAPTGSIEVSWELVANDADIDCAAAGIATARLTASGGDEVTVDSRCDETCSVADRDKYCYRLKDLLLGAYTVSVELLDSGGASQGRVDLEASIDEPRQVVTVGPATFDFSALQSTF